MAQRTTYRSLAPFYPDPPIRFTLAGTSFTADPDPPPSVVMDMVLSLTTDERGKRSHHMGAILRALHALVPTDDHRRLDRTLTGKARPVTGPVLGRLVIWLAEATTGRPTVPSGGWSAGRWRTGATSTVTC